MADTPTSAAAMTALHELLRLKGMDAVIDYHYQMAQSPTPSPARERHEAEHDRLVAIRNAAEPAAWEAARAALAQAASAQVEAVQAQPASAPMGQRKWPFVESPGEFTKRLEWAWREFGALLPAVRYVLIESPPQFYRPPAPAGMPLSEEQILRVFFDVYGDDNTTHAVPWAFARAIESAHGISGESSRATNGVRGGDDTSHLDCWEARDAGHSTPICEPCNTGNRAGCLYKRRATNGVADAAKTSDGGM